MNIHNFSDRSVQEKPTFEFVYEKYYPSVLRYLLKHTGNLHDAEDLTADTFLYCYQRYDQFDPLKSAVATWLYLTVNSRLKNYYRDKKEHVELSELEEYLFSSDQEMEHAVYLEELRCFLADRLERLPEQQRTVIVMRFFQQKEFEEIAAVLGTTAGNIRVILSRTLDKLNKDVSSIIEDWRV